MAKNKASEQRAKELAKLKAAVDKEVDNRDLAFKRAATLILKRMDVTCKQAENYQRTCARGYDEVWEMMIRLLQDAQEAVYRLTLKEDEGGKDYNKHLSAAVEAGKRLQRALSAPFDELFG